MWCLGDNDLRLKMGLRKKAAGGVIAGLPPEGHTGVGRKEESGQRPSRERMESKPGQAKQQGTVRVEAGSQGVLQRFPIGLDFGSTDSLGLCVEEC